MKGTDAQACSVTLFPSGFTWNDFNVTVAKTMNQHTRVKTFTGLVVVVTPSSLSRLLVFLCQDFLGNFGVQGWFAIAFPSIF